VWLRTSAAGLEASRPSSFSSAVSAILATF